MDDKVTNFPNKKGNLVNPIWTFYKAKLLRFFFSSCRSSSEAAVLVFLSFALLTSNHHIFFIRLILHQNSCRRRAQYFCHLWISEQPLYQADWRRGNKSPSPENSIFRPNRREMGLGPTDKVDHLLTGFLPM